MLTNNTENGGRLGMAVVASFRMGVASRNRERRWRVGTAVVASLWKRGMETQGRRSWRAGDEHGGAVLGCVLRVGIGWLFIFELK